MKILFLNLELVHLFYRLLLRFPRNLIPYCDIFKGILLKYCRLVEFLLHKFVLHQLAKSRPLSFVVLEHLAQSVV